ncbi:MAG: isoaspartyl peptidase/L-asparaginase [Bacteroidetes bacterium]|nr:MAG: isoaspartyl peptidase/L-asparaginase [Bacteroidota bacterium]
MKKYSLAIHGGAGTISKAQLTPEKELLYHEALQKALNVGKYFLENGGTALDAVEFSVRCLEDIDLFNAGKGSVFGNDGKHEMEASIMCGSTLNAGAVAGIRNVKNPIQLARMIKKNTDYVYLHGSEAENFAKINHLPFEDDFYFYTQERFDQLQAVKHSDKVILDHTDVDYKFGTVGAVALDQHGNLAAATSTGGLTNKKYGRLGDSSIIGAGTYANNETCAISCTGYGEYFIRAVVAHDVSCLMQYKGLTLQQASEIVVKDKLIKMGGEGGLIGVDADGNIALVFNSEGMYRGYTSNKNTNLITEIYGN